MKGYTRHLRTNKGFTLLELLVVVSILATMAGIGVRAIGGYIERAREDLVNTEMKNIGEAIVKFNSDTGYFPGEGLFASKNETNVDKSDFSFLFYPPVRESAAGQKKGEEILPWDMDEKRGWNGPYLTLDSIDYMRTEGCEKGEFKDDIRVFPVNANNREESNSIIALEDPFKSRARARQKTSSCFVNHADSQKFRWEKEKYTGQPYLYETAFKNDRYLECPENGAGCIALLSAGKNGTYENGNNDDVVKILRINK